MRLLQEGYFILEFIKGVEEKDKMWVFAEH